MGETGLCKKKRFFYQGNKNRILAVSPAHWLTFGSRMALDSALDNEIFVFVDDDRALGQLDEVGLVLQTATRLVVAFEGQRRVAVDRAERVGRPTRIDAQVGRRDVVQRQRRAGRAYLRRRWQQFSVPEPRDFRRWITCSANDKR